MTSGLKESCYGWAIRDIERKVALQQTGRDSSGYWRLPKGSMGNVGVNEIEEIERLFMRLKGFHRIFSHFAKRDVMFTGFIHFAFIVEALKLC